MIVMLKLVLRLSEHISPTSQSECACIVQLYALFSNAWSVSTSSYITDLGRHKFIHQS